MAANQTANFVVKAKDAATGPLGKVGGSMGKLKRTAGTAFKGIAAGAAIAAGAIAGLATVAVKGAISEEKSIILTNAALRQRGFDLEALGPKVEAQVKAFEEFGLEGENVRAGIEAGSRFFKDQTQLLEANAIAANIAAVTDQDLATVMGIIGKASQGQTRGLKTLGIEVKKGAKLKDILAAADEKYAGIADELANSTGGKMLAAQEKFNGAMDELGMDLLPMINEVLTFITEKALPGFRDLMEELGPRVATFVDEYVRPLVDTFAELFDVLSEGDVSIIDLLFVPLKLILGTINSLITGIVAGIKFIQGFGGAAALAAGSAARDYQTGGYARGDMGGQSSYRNTSQGLGTYVFPISIGTGKVDTVVADSIRRIGPGSRRNNP
jgi:hypothetical protein